MNLRASRVPNRTGAAGETGWTACMSVMFVPPADGLSLKCSTL
ncbi:hypothetical protein MMEU_0144 [Mycobacterium marinum str. Europe]|nr:hypothetical protein MMEU_0144 [Mycobacterium marinum str. Europe]